MAIGRAEELFREGLTLLGKQDFRGAEKKFIQIAKLMPRHVPTLMNLALTQHRLGKLDAAIAAAQTVRGIDPRNIDACMFLSAFYREQNRHRDALKACDSIIALNPGLADAHSNKAAILNALGEYQQAVSSADTAIRISPQSPDAHLNRGNALFNLKQYDAALTAYDKAVQIAPGNIGAWLGRANTHAELKRYDVAVDAYDKVLQQARNFAPAWLGRGNVSRDLKRYNDAFAAYERALSFEPDLAEAWLGLGDVCYLLKRCDDARAAYDKALAIKSDLAGAWIGRGNVAGDLTRFDEALIAYDKAIALNAGAEGAWLGRGNVLSALRHHDEALAAYNKALALSPHLAPAYSGRGNLFYDLKRYDEAFSSYDRAFAIEPDLPGVEGARLHAKMLLCDWRDLDSDRDHLIQSVYDGKANTAPWALMIVSSSPEDQLKCATAWNASYYSQFSGRVAPRGPYQHDRIRIAYVSSDLRQHPIGQLTVGMFECHDRSKFEVTGISIGPDDRSPLRQRLESAFDEFIDAKAWTDDYTAEQIAKREIDILIDLNGFTQYRRTGIFARRPAPIAVNYLGFPGTMGADYMDYIIGDSIVIPPSQQSYYSEKVVYLPHSYQANDSRRQISETMVSRAECRLPEQGFVFCCFNNSCKIVPAIFDCWMRILAAVDGSVLWLLQENEFAADNLRREASARNINPDRLIFAPRMPLSDHLARHRLADLFLDTLPYNAHTTASDALWAGLPVVTCLGGTFAGRVAASLLTAAGLNDMITSSLADYERLVLELARDKPLLGDVKARLARNRNACALFDTTLFTRGIEAAYRTMWQRQQRGEALMSFSVDASG